MACLQRLNVGTVLLCALFSIGQFATENPRTDESIPQSGNVHVNPLSGPTPAGAESQTSLRQVSSDFMDLLSARFEAIDGRFIAQDQRIVRLADECASTNHNGRIDDSLRQIAEQQERHVDVEAQLAILKKQITQQHHMMTGQVEQLEALKKKVRKLEKIKNYDSVADTGDEHDKDVDSDVHGDTSQGNCVCKVRCPSCPTCPDVYIPDANNGK